MVVMFAYKFVTPPMLNNGIWGFGLELIPRFTNMLIVCIILTPFQIFLEGIVEYKDWFSSSMNTIEYPMYKKDYTQNKMTYLQCVKYLYNKWSK